MSDSSTPANVCPVCGQRGRRVDTGTVKALLAVSLRAVQEGTSYYFCRAADCDVVYFMRTARRSSRWPRCASASIKRRWTPMRCRCATVSATRAAASGMSRDDGQEYGRRRDQRRHSGGAMRL